MRRSGVFDKTGAECLSLDWRGAESVGNASYNDPNSPNE